jgi:hypothetical protein
MMQDLEEQIAQELSEQMSSAIDFEILADVLVNACDWHRVDLERFQNNRQAVDVTSWCHDTLKNEWKRSGSHFVFADQGDAVNFTLRWR